MRADLSSITVITDRSGSMESIKSDAIGGFNSFIKGQKEVPGDATVTLVLFDDRYEVPYSNVTLKKVPMLNNKTFVPRGSTALLDAIGRTIVDLGAQLDALPEDEKPGNVIIVIITDGAENSSKEYTNEKIKEMITHQTNVYNWQFIYIAANVDTFAMARQYGINVNNSYSFTADRVGTQVAYETMTDAVAMARSGGDSNVNWAVEPQVTAN